MNQFHRNHFWAGLFLLALGCFIVQQSQQWQILGANGPGVGFFPLAYGSLIVLLALVLTLKSFWAQRREARQRLQGDDLAQTKPTGNLFSAMSVCHTIRRYAFYPKGESVVYLESQTRDSGYGIH